jgi:hypothetical protein
MKSSTTAEFRRLLAELPPEVRKTAHKQFRLWMHDPQHSSVRFKKVGEMWSARVDRRHRALAIDVRGTIVWFYIGTHDGYERRI